MKQQTRAKFEVKRVVGGGGAMCPMQEKGGGIGRGIKQEGGTSNREPKQILVLRGPSPESGKTPKN